jgi:hypothetical protein
VCVCQRETLACVRFLRGARGGEVEKKSGGVCESLSLFTLAFSACAHFPPALFPSPPPTLLHQSWRTRALAAPPRPAPRRPSPTRKWGLGGGEKRERGSRVSLARSREVSPVACPARRLATRLPAHTCPCIWPVDVSRPLLGCRMGLGERASETCGERCTRQGCGVSVFFLMRRGALARARPGAPPCLLHPTHHPKAGSAGWLPPERRAEAGREVEGRPRHTRALLFQWPRAQGAPPPPRRALHCIARAPRAALRAPRAAPRAPRMRAWTLSSPLTLTSPSSQSSPPIPALSRTRRRTSRPPSWSARRRPTA